MLNSQNISFLNRWITSEKKTMRRFARWLFKKKLKNYALMLKICSNTTYDTRRRIISEEESLTQKCA